MDVIRKDATIENTDDASPGSFRVVLSTAAQDRDGDELKSEDWEQPLPAHVTFDQDHGMSVATTVGSGVPTIDNDGRLIVEGTYSSLPRAQEVRTLVGEGHIRTTSVAFMTKTVTKGGKSVKVRELLNGAFVAIPSNREALVLDSKSVTVRPDELGEIVRKAVSDAQRETKAVAAGVVSVKTVADSYEQRQQAIGDALDAVHPDPVDGGYCYAWPLATFEDSVVYRVGSSDPARRGQFQRDYTVADDGTVTLGDARRVNLVEVVQPVPGEDTPKGYRAALTPKNFDPADAEVDAPENADETKSAADSAAAATKAAAAEPTADDLDVQLRGLLATAGVSTDE